MLMAAGLGSRMRPFTDVCPKPLLPLMGVPMAQFSLDMLKQAEVSRVVANVHHLPEVTRQAIRFLDGPKDWIISDESSKLLGSAGGIAQALPHFDNEPFFYVNADVLCHVNLKDLAQQHAYLRHQYGVRVTLCVLLQGPRGGKYSEIQFDRRTHLIRGVGDKHEGRAMFASVAVVEPEAVLGISAHEPSDFVEKILNPSIRMGRAGCHIIDNTLESTPSSWFDIGNPEMWRSTHLSLMRLIEEEECPTLWKNRILKNNHPLASGIWTSKRSALTEKPSSWRGPCYWAPEGTDVHPPVEMAPNSVLYGRPTEGWVPESGIGFRGLWQTI